MEFNKAGGSCFELKDTYVLSFLDSFVVAVIFLVVFQNTNNELRLDFSI